MPQARQLGGAGAGASFSGTTADGGARAQLDGAPEETGAARSAACFQGVAMLLQCGGQTAGSGSGAV